MLFRRKLSALLLLALVLSVFTGCGQSKTTKGENANSSQNIAQIGLVALGDDWVYYTDMNEGKLYKVKPDGSEKTKLSDNGGYYLNLVDDWLFFTKASSDQLDPENGMLFKMKTDGSERTQIGTLQGQHPYVAGTTIYAIDSTDNQAKLYKIMSDGTGQSILAEANISNFVVSGDWIYYLEFHSEENKTLLHKVKTDGTENQPLSVTSPLGVDAFAVHGDWIYYRPTKAENAEQNPLWSKMKTDGTEDAEFADLGSGGINIGGDWIYFGAPGVEAAGMEKPDAPLSKIKLDGTEKTEIAPDDATFIYLYDDVIYFVSIQFSMDTGFAIIINRVKKDGTGKEVFVKAQPTETAPTATDDEGRPAENPELVVACGPDYTLFSSQDMFGTRGGQSFNQDDRYDTNSWMGTVALAAGQEHMLNLRPGGSVASTGVNTYGQLDVSAWRQVTAIAAGGYHSVGLRQDGTVVAVGDNRAGQCNVSEWREIVAIAAGTSHTLGLKKDGTVLAAGDNSFGQSDVSSWTEIKALAAGANHSLSVKSDGTVVAVGDNREGQCDVSSWTDIKALAAGDAHSVGLKNDGTVVAVGGKVTVEGQTYDPCAVDSWRDVKSIYAGFGHTVAQLENNDLVATGNNAYGQCDVDIFG